MSHTYPLAAPHRIMPLGIVLIALLGVVVYAVLTPKIERPVPSGGYPTTTVYATGTTPGGLAFDYEVITSDQTVDWAGGGDFDPRGKCPDDFFGAGFVMLFKKMSDGSCFRFLYHKGKKLLYRIDKDLIRGKETIGLHWVTGTQFSARYRIADGAYRGGKPRSVPNAKGGVDAVPFRYGEAVSKKRGQPGRELFRETHIDPEQCPSWWDLFTFMP